ncbi:MAG: cyclic lactone autoinducer peptide [Clostridiaceae bacterium]|nr:cyclic lactone autoinducer peptide [Clostridiaceae bacterium]
MLNIIKRNILSITASVLTLVAMSGVSTTSMWAIYEPDMPESIKKDL